MGFVMMDDHPEGSASPAYRSGAVARLTGIPVETLRVWERRHNVVGPRQSATGQRQYAPEDVTRLSVIKRLVDSGYAIGSIAALGQDQLQSMLQQAADPWGTCAAVGGKLVNGKGWCVVWAKKA